MTNSEDGSGAMQSKSKFDEALNHHQAGRLSEAERRYREILVDDPQNPALYGNLAAVLTDQGKVEEAIACFHEALVVDPGFIEAHFGLGILLQANDQMDDAIGSYGRVLSINPDYFEAHVNLGVVFQHQGLLENAAKCYRRALAINSEFAEVHHNLGIVLHDQGKPGDAVISFQCALDLKPNYLYALNGLAVALQKQGKYDEALASFKYALAVDPEFAEAHHNLGTVLYELEELGDAVDSFQRALDLNPEYVDALNGRAVALQEQGKHDEAVAAFQRAIEIDPGFAVGHYNLGNARRDQGSLDEAVSSYGEALRHRPDYAEAQNGLAVALQKQGKSEAAMALFREVIRSNPEFSETYGRLGAALMSDGRLQESLAQFEIKLAYERGENPVNPNHRSYRYISKPKIDHDIEQFRYLATLGNESEHFDRLAGSYETVRKEIDWSNSGGFLVPLSDDHRERIGETYNRAHHVAEAPKISGPAVNPEIDVATITDDYFKNSPGMTYFGDLLTADALAALRRYLLESTIWFGIEHEDGYLGSYLHDGFACPLILQIAEELSSSFPDIFIGHSLNQAWAFKYDSRMSGIKVHADFAAININFWITPGSANRDPDHGGLVVYDVEAPLDWNFKAYNTDVARMREYLAENSSGKMVVPYAENRVVMFNSNLFHETDLIDFLPGYENRRINITMLFGQRSN